MPVKTSVSAVFFEEETAPQAECLEKPAGGRLGAVKPDKALPAAISSWNLERIPEIH